MEELGKRHVLYVRVRYVVEDAPKGDVAIAYVAGTLRSGGVAIERLCGVAACSAASAVREIVADPIVVGEFAFSHSPNPLRLIDEPAAAVAAGKLTTAAADPSPVRSTSGVGEVAT